MHIINKEELLREIEKLKFAANAISGGRTRLKTDEAVRYHRLMATHDALVLIHNCLENVDERNNLRVVGQTIS